MRWLVACLFLVGCELYQGPSPSPHPLAPDAPAGAAVDAAPDAPPANSVCGKSGTTNEAACPNIDCGPDHHCEVQCQPPGTDGCVYQCHSVCVVNECCSTINCGGTKTCVESCARDCQAMAQYCNESCVDNSMLGCNAITTEAGCLARSDCIPIYNGVGCTCTFTACDCQNPMGGFARCESAMP